MNELPIQYRIQQAVESAFGVDLDADRSRRKPTYQARAVMVYLLRRMTSWSFPKIARFMGWRSHTSALHAYYVASHGVRDDEQCCIGPWKDTILRLRKRVHDMQGAA